MKLELYLYCTSLRTLRKFTLLVTRAVHSESWLWNSENVFQMLLAKYTQVVLSYLRENNIFNLTEEISVCHVPRWKDFQRYKRHYIHLFFLQGVCTHSC